MIHAPVHAFHQFGVREGKCHEPRTASRSCTAKAAEPSCVQAYGSASERSRLLGLKLLSDAVMKLPVLHVTRCLGAVTLQLL